MNENDFHKTPFGLMLMDIMLISKSIPNATLIDTGKASRLHPQ